MIRTLSLSLCLSLVVAAVAPAAEPPAEQEVAELVADTQAWFFAQQQEDGSFLDLDKFRLGGTLLAVDALTFGPDGIPFDDPRIVKALAFVDRFINEDGSVSDGNYANYTTSLALIVWARSNTQNQWTILRAQNFLRGIQNTDPADINRGGIGYGSSGPTHEDLNNTTFAVTALRDSGVPADDPAMKAALEFVERCQNLSSHNDLSWAGNGGDDNVGGGVYAPHQSKAGGSWSDEEQAKAAVEEAMRTNVLRSYGSMSYSLITSFLYLDLKPGDPRLDAALDWCSRNYVFDKNPGMPPEQDQEGLFYYYQIMSKSFFLLDLTEIPGNEGSDWRADLFAAIKERAVESENGGTFWINSDDRWAEGIPQISTSYVLKSLARIQQSL